MNWFDELQANGEPDQTAKPVVPPQDWFSSVTETMSAMPEGKKMAPMAITEDATRMASVSRQAAASLPTDDMARVRYFAQKRFPEISLNKAVDKYVYRDGRLAYQGDDGKFYYEEPKLRAPTSMGNISQYPKAVASGAGPALPMVGGTIGGIAAMGEGPPGWLTGIVQSAAGGAAGDVTRQLLASQITGEKKSLIGRATQTGGAMLEQGVAQLLGNAFAKGLSHFGRTPTYNIPETTALRAASNRFGIRLTPGEETGNRTLLRRQKILANTTEGEEKFTSFYEGRNDQVRSAVDSVLNNLSPNNSPRMASASGVEGAKKAIDAESASLSDLARPDYKEAEKGFVPIDQLTGGPSGERIKIAIESVKGNRAYSDTIKTMPNDSMPVVDAAKKWLDDEVKVAIRAGRDNEARLWQEAADELRTTADANVPAYGKARAIFEENVPTRTALKNGVVGDVTKLEGNDTLKAGRIIFGKGSSPEDIRLARAAFEKAGATQQWDDLSRSYLQQIFNDIPDSSTGSITNLGGTYRKAVMGNHTKRKQLEAAFEGRPEFWGEFLDLMKVLDATGKAMKGESITAFAQAGQKELAAEGAGLGPAAMETVEFWKTPSRVSRYWADVNASKYAARQAELLTTPEGRQVLRELKKLGPGSAGSVMALSHFLTTGGAGLAGAALSQPPDGPVSSTSTTVSGPTR